VTGEALAHSKMPPTVGGFDSWARRCLALGKG